MSLDDDLAEWARWVGQGATYGMGYPAEACTESLAIPYRRCGTAAEQFDDFMASRPADERTGERVERMVRRLIEPLRAAIQVRYVLLPGQAPELDTQRMRAVATQWSYRSGRRQVMTRDDYLAALALALDALTRMSYVGETTGWPDLPANDLRSLADE